MSDETSLPSRSNEGETTVPPWLPQLLRETNTRSVAFGANCLRAGQTALAVVRMRQVGQRMNPPLMGVPAYLRGLAGAAGVTLDPVLRWAKLDLDRPADGAFGASWGRLAVAFGLPDREALLHLRLTFVDEVDPGLWDELVLAARSSNGGNSLLERCEQRLDEAQQTWDGEIRRRLADGEAALWATYRQAARADELA